MTWDSDDQDKALAWRILEHQKCPGCGLLPGEKAKVSAQVCPTCRNVQMESASQDFRRKPGNHILLRRVDG